MTMAPCIRPALLPLVVLVRRHIHNLLAVVVSAELGAEVSVVVGLSRRVGGLGGAMAASALAVDLYSSGAAS